MVNRRLLSAAIVLLLTVELLKTATLLSMGPAPLVWDASQYWRLGGMIADGDWMLARSEIAFRTPGYPVFVGFFRSLFGPQALAAAVVAQHLLVAATSLLTGLLSYRLSGRPSWGLMAAALSICCLTRAWHANTLLSDTLFVFLLVTHTFALVGFLRRPTVAGSVAVGATLGLCILVRPVAQLLWAPVYAVALLPPRFGGPPQRFAPACGRVAVGLLAMTVVLAPWLARNWTMFGSPSLISLTGRNLWIVCFQGGAGAGLRIPSQGTAPERLATVLAESDTHVNLVYAWEVSDALRQAGWSDVEADQLMKSVCVQAIRAEPGRFAYRLLKRFVDYWRCVVNAYPFFGPPAPPAGAYLDQHVWRSEPLATVGETVLQRPLARSLAANMLFSVAAWFGVAVLVLRRDTRAIGLALGLMLLYFATITATFEIPNYRYRMVIEPLLITAVCTGLASLVRGQAAPR